MLTRYRAGLRCVVWCVCTEQLERLRLLPENVWNEIEAMESGLGPKGGLMGMKGCSTVFFFAVIAFIFLLGAVGGLVGLYFAAGSPCLPGEACNVPPSDVNGTARLLAWPFP